MPTSSARSAAFLPLELPDHWPARLAAVSGARGHDVRPGEALRRAGDADAVVACVRSGAFVIEHGSPAGRRCIVRLLGPGDVDLPQAFAKELRAVSHDRPSLTRLADDRTSKPQSFETATTTVALVRSSVVVVPISVLVREFDHDAKMAAWATAALIELNDDLCARLARALSLPVTERVAEELRSLSVRFGRPAPAGTRIALPLTQDLIAALVGATRESVNRAVRTLVRSGAITHLDGRYVVLNEGASP